jgi:nicotinamidase-related amidase
VVDVLQGIFELGQPLHDGDHFLSVVEELVSRARAHGVAVIFVRHLGPPGSPFAPRSAGGRIHPRLEPREGELVVEKRHPDAFMATDLERALGEAGVEELVVCGFATEGCIDATVRGAYARGYAVVLVADGHTTTRNAVLEAHQIVAHHNLVLGRFARVLEHERVTLAE